MSNPVISVRNLGKKYRLGATLSPDTLRDHIMHAAGRLLGRGNGEMRRPQNEEFWALKDISFDVQQGEVLGVIGPNGSGKSTLLKILTRITEPTEGEVRLKGRVASLLEVGTGFHQELTGRENIYMNGAILGMTRAEINAKFDEIVAFAGVDKFLDTPVKRYSSGMRVRLGFAVAAHLEPEILLVDEVLAVGDVAFQKKCVGKMEDVANQGRTVLFVSHNMAAIARLCSRAMLLNAGAVEDIGDVASVTRRYSQEGTQAELSWTRSRAPRRDAFFTSVYLADPALKPTATITSADMLSVVMTVEVRDAPRDLQLSMSLADDKGEWIFSSCPQDAGLELPSTPGIYSAVVSCPPGILLPRLYSLRCALWSPTSGGIEANDELRFSVGSTNSFAEAYSSGRAGVLALKCDWLIDRA